MRKTLILSTVVCVLFGVLPAQQNASSTTPEPGDYQETESYVDRARRETAVLEMSLRDAMRLALTNNLEIAIEDFNEDLNRERTVTTLGYYDPLLSFTVGVESSDNPSTSVLTAGVGISTFSSDRFTWNNQVQQNLPGGGALTLGFNNTRNETNSQFSTINPQFGSDLDFNFVQPLWRGFRKTSTDRQLKLVNLDSQISDSQFQQKVSEIIQRLQDQYWELVFAIQDHETRRRSMELARVQYRDNLQRVRIGVMAPIEVTSARAEVSTREQEMIQAEVQIVSALNALKYLLAPDPGHSIWNLMLIPTDPPEALEITIDMDQAIQTALARRPELEQLRLQLEKNGVDYQYYERDGKPTVNLRFSYGSTGRSGVVFANQTIADTQQRLEDPNSPAFGNLGTAFGQVFSFDFNSWGVFADVQIPLFNRSNEGQIAQVRIEEARLLSLMKNQQQLIIVDVRNAFESLAIQKKRLEAARIARQLSEEQLEGENKRFDAGLSTNFEVLRFQRDLAQAEVQELRAKVDFQKALTALKNAMYTIVDDNDLILARKNGPDE